MATQEDYPGQFREIKTNAAIRKAVEAADRIILEASDGSVEETDFLTMRVMEAFTMKVIGRIQATYLSYCIRTRHPTVEPPFTFAGEMAQVVIQLPGHRAVLRNARELVSFLAGREAAKFQPRQISVRIEYVNEKSGQKEKENNR